MIAVTAASSNHAGALGYMLASLRRLHARVECDDLGLTASEVAARPRWDGLFYHKFDYASYPPHMNVEVNAGEYAWKPAIVADVVERTPATGHRSAAVRERVYREIIVRWRDCAMNKDCADLGVRCKCDRWFSRDIGFHVPAPVYAWCCLY